MNFAKMRNLVLINFVLMIIFTACEHDQSMSPDVLQATFSSIQKNILTPKCVNAGCHPGGGAPMSLESNVAFMNLVNVTSVRYGTLLRVMPGDAENSVLYLKVAGDPRTGARMPLNLDALSNDKIEAIREWINQGAKNN